MVHVSFPPIRTASLPKKALLAILWLASMLFLLPATSLANSNSITAITGNKAGDFIELRISTQSEPTFTVYELFNPPRIVVDMAETELPATTATSIPDNLGITLQSENIKDITPQLLRLVVTLQQSTSFDVQQEANEVVLAIKETGESVGSNEAAASGLAINDVKVDTSPTKTTVTLSANADIDDFNYDTLDREGSVPPRLYIDINNVTGDSLLQEQLVGTALSRIRVAKRGSGLRFVFDSSLDEIFDYEIKTIAQGLEISIEEKPSEDQIAQLINQKTDIESQLPEVDPLAKQLSPQATEKKMQDAFNFSGYNKERITVDFYKIDLHNVFRLFREVSGINIVVDPAVTGSLTLALDDVPWDFALDIILNLKDLAKEERFNTLVILPKNKSFEWAKQAENNITFEADVAVAEQEALIIKQQKSVSKEVVEAKQLMGQAKMAEKAENFEDAVMLYEQALKLWPENDKLANKIASIYLVYLGQNAKAVFFAKKALAVQPENTAASLNAAIALANMKESKQAMELFDMSVAVERPSSEALLSYAVFSEESQEYASALKLLNKHDMLYGKSLDSMVSTARIYDKMGDHAVSTDKYEAILLSGFRIPPDLAKYIQSRIALKQAM